jgi:hypothetical protein
MGLYRRSAGSPAELGGKVPDRQFTRQAFQLGNIIVRPSTFSFGHTQLSLQQRLNAGI